MIMAACRFSNLPKFREVFQKNPDIKMQSWYPPHMFRGMKQMQAKLATVDCIIEMHDARIPFSGRNPIFQSMLTAIRPHIFVLNKMDLANLTHKDRIEDSLKKEGFQNILFTDCTKDDKNDIDKIVPMAVELIQNNDDINFAFKPEYKMMVIGVPNVGKSSLINRLRNKHLRRRKATLVGAKPGITKSVLHKIKVLDEPPIYLLDTPGVMQPKIKDLEVGLRLALCNTLADNLVGEELIADYLLFWLNKHRNFEYVDYLGIPEPLDNVKLLLFQSCRVLNKTLKIRTTLGTHAIVPDLKSGAMHFIDGFRTGAYGKVLLDEDFLFKNG